MNEAQRRKIVYQSLDGRYYDTSLGVFIIIGLVVFFLFLLELLKFMKKIYTHNIPFHQNKYLATKLSIRQQKVPQILQSQYQVNNNQQVTKYKSNQLSEIAGPTAQQKTTQFISGPRQQTVQELGKSVKGIKASIYNEPFGQQRLIRFSNLSFDIVKHRLPVLAIAFLSIPLLASFQFLITTVCIGTVLFVVIQILKTTQHQNIAWILDLISHAVVISWFANLFSVGMPI